MGTRGWIPASSVLALVLLNALSASAGDLLSKHKLHRYGTFDSTYEDVWEDLSEDVYGDGKLDDLYRDPCRLYDLGRGTWACPGCRYTPLHYEAVRPCVLTSHTPSAGASWYRGVPVGYRQERPLAAGAGPYDKSQRVP